MIEIWDPETYELPAKEEARLSFDLISDTSLMSLVKAKTYALSAALSETHLAFYCRDRKIRIFNIKSGALTSVIDDSLQIYIDYQATALTVTKTAFKSDLNYLEKLDFERRMAGERDIEKAWDAPKTPESNHVMPAIGFDESGTYIYFGSPVGIKVVNVISGEHVRANGKVENTERFLQIALYQGKPQKSTQ